MSLNTVIFDMDGLLIDSEPLWAAAATEVLQRRNLTIDEDVYANLKGLRTRDFILSFFRLKKLNTQMAEDTVIDIFNIVNKKIESQGKIMPGVPFIVKKFKDLGFRIGIASSSPISIIETGIKIAGIENSVDKIVSAEKLAFGKPHPMVYLECATSLKASEENCICFEDSFNGMIAAKAARMCCVVVPAQEEYDQLRWNAADLKLHSLEDFSEEKLKMLPN